MERNMEQDLIQPPNGFLVKLKPKIETKEVSFNQDIELIQFAVNIIWGGLFFVYSTQQNRRCQSLRDGSYYFSYFLLAFAALKLLINMPLFCFLQNKSTQTRSYLKRYFKVCDVIEFLIYLTFAVALTIFISRNEQCGDLRTLTTVFLSLVVSALGLTIFVLGCCSLCIVCTRE